jgi:oxygen-independent coproporphyrinogen-3 oxidase
MCNFRVDFDAIEKRHGIDFADYFADDLAALAEHEADGMVTVGDDAIEATPVGELFVRNLAMCFDRYLRDKQGDQPVFSRTM